jgi:hypothetical protein
MMRYRAKSSGSPTAPSGCGAVDPSGRTTDPSPSPTGREAPAIRMAKKKSGRSTPARDRASALPQDLRAGDRFTDTDGTEWALIEHPVVMLGGKKHRAQVRGAVRPPQDHSA